MKNIYSIVEEIKNIKKSKKTVFIAIEGFGGGGKTTFAIKLHKALDNSFVIHIDDFIIKEKLTEDSWDKGVFDRSRLEKQILSPLTNGLEAKYQKLIWETDTLSEFIRIPNIRYIIVEGISSYHPEIEKYYDYKIWIDTPIIVAKERGYIRDGNNNTYWDIWAKNDLDYKLKYHPEQRANVIVGNS